jgi:hypothetical protein
VAFVAFVALVALTACVAFVAAGTVLSVPSLMFAPVSESGATCRPVMNGFVVEAIGALCLTKDGPALATPAVATMSAIAAITVAGEGTRSMRRTSRLLSI